MCLGWGYLPLETGGGFCAAICGMLEKILDRCRVKANDMFDSSVRSTYPSTRSGKTIPFNHVL